MRINKLTFENLNSYEGKVEIDFTHPDFAKGNNQFVICGPMGAGKSTILDAITLALFGSTARLGRMTISSREASGELMNKRSVSCSASVVYSCAKGNFESSFLQRRARGKLSGKLQPPECRIINADTGEDQIDSRTTDALGKKNEELIGLSYDQFVRCILIPQGEFGKFLGSSDRDKAAILAKLSHTEYYKQVAVRLNEKASAISKEYHELEAERDRFAILSPEDRSKNEEEKLRLAGEVKEQAKAQGSLQEKLSWIARVEEANRTFEGTKKALEQLQSKAEEFGQKSKKLANANKAKDCELPYKSLIDAQRALADETEKEKKAQQILLDNQNRLESVREAYQTAEQAYQDKKTEKQKLQILWDQVLELDTRFMSASAIQKEKRDAYEKAVQSYNSAKSIYDDCHAQKEQLEEKIKEQKEYLTSHSMDGELPSVLAVFKEKKDDLSDAWLMLAYTGDETRRLSREGAQIAEKKEELQTSLRSLEDKLKEYISDRYKQVVSILRRDLTVGKPCPVCRKIVGGDGVEDESAHDHTSEADKELNARLLEMEEQIRQTEETLSDLETKRIKQEGDLAGVKRDGEKAETAKEKTVADLNELLAAWDIQLAGDCDDTELSAVQKQLEQRSTKYQQANDAYTEADRKYRDLAGKLEAVDLKQAEITCIEAKQVSELALDDLRKIRDQRIELFGETTVKEAEKRFDAELLAKEADSKQKAEKLSTVREAIRSAESAGEQCAIRIRETIEKIKACEAAFSEALVRNGFADETEFLSCIVEPAQLQTLETEVRDYEKKKTAAETSLKDAKENLTKLQETPRTEESAEALQQNLQQLQAKMQDNNQRIGALEEILKNDDQNRIKRAEAEKRLEDVGKEGRIFARISEMLGKNDGSDFEVFVQSIAMKSLLAKANQYLSGIIPKYELVQKSGSIDFEVHETAGDGNVSVRQVSNFSGGERFIISLCLALAMSEFAGQNGDVECIFLDEGFGTLSGQPLLDAIDALKRLSSTGKMLGIITHIETVIQSFMPIEAVRKGDRSILTGPGVTYTPASMLR